MGNTILGFHREMIFLYRWLPKHGWQREKEREIERDKQREIGPEKQKQKQKEGDN